MGWSCFKYINFDGTFVLMVKWLVKHYLSELKPNGGASMVDKVNRLESRVDEIYRLLVEK